MIKNILKGKWTFRIMQNFQVKTKNLTQASTLASSLITKIPPWKSERWKLLLGLQTLDVTRPKAPATVPETQSSMKCVLRTLPKVAYWVHWQHVAFTKPLTDLSPKERFLEIPPMLWRRQWHPTPVLLPGKSMDRGAWWAVVHGVTKSRAWLNDFTLTFHLHALEKEMATHSSVLAWRIPGTGEPGGLPSMGSHRVGHDWSDLAAAAAADQHESAIGIQRYTCLYLAETNKILWRNYPSIKR